MPLRRSTAGLLFGALLAAGALAACEQPPPREPGALAFVVGGRSNMPQPALVESVLELHDEAVLSNDKMFVIGVSGSPKLLYQEKIEQDCDSDDACDAEVEVYRRQTADLLARVRADAPEADLLGAIVLAARSVTAAGSRGPKRIVVIDNGLQTAGDLRLQSPGALSVDPQTQAQAMQNAGKLAHLNGVEIYLTGLGVTMAPQARLDSTQQSKLQAIWTAVLGAGGAQVQVQPDVLNETAPASGLPAVAVIQPDQPIGPAGEGCYRIRDDQVGFRPNEATFRDPAEAREVLTPIADSLRRNRSTATVVGTTALPEKDPSNPLSTARAKAVVDILVEAGVARNQLIPSGVGTSFAGYVDPHDAGGHFDEIRAVQDRLVIVQEVGRPCTA